MAKDKPETPMPAAQLLSYLVQSGTPEATCLLSQKWVDANPKGTALDLLEYLRAQKVYASTITKLGKFVHSDPAWEARTVLPEDAADEITNLRRQIAAKDQTIKEMSARIGGLTATLELEREQKTDLTRKVDLFQRQEIMNRLPELGVPEPVKT